MSAEREAVITGLVEKWHGRACDCSLNSCPVRVDGRNKAVLLIDLAGEGLRKRGLL